ncbi:membrane protein insertase YidC [Clostridium oryzae]|uniref:Membrane protein insertase MisCA n=1 Tax=Clostridium oryzae TaxID=1450648 RepID=A0A1V4IFN5_9CLOT|nr:membrane protein insertase YidC [Clostridium oryzae]OPJ58670.1 membrane protein insertase MisCA precursor [Clostridium oryzae]
MSFLGNLLNNFFELIHQFVKIFVQGDNYSYGLTIILFTVIIRLLMLPLNIKSTKSSAKMQELQPKMQEIQNKYKNDPQKSQQELMKLYKEHGTSPFGGCLPILIQFPVLMAMYSILYSIKGIDNVHFLWFTLGKPDNTFILTILAILTTYVSSAIMMPKGDNPQAKTMSTMNIMMAGVIGVSSLKLKSALVMYWVVSNLIQLGQSVFMIKMGLIKNTVGSSILNREAEKNEETIKSKDLNNKSVNKSVSKKSLETAVDSKYRSKAEYNSKKNVSKSTGNNSNATKNKKNKTNKNKKK